MTINTSTYTSATTIIISRGKKSVTIRRVPYTYYYWEPEIKTREKILLESKMDPEARNAIEDLYKNMIEGFPHAVYNDYLFDRDDNDKLSLLPMQILNLEIEKDLMNFLLFCETYCQMPCCDFNALEITTTNAQGFKVENGEAFWKALDQAKKIVDEIKLFTSTKKFPYIQQSTLSVLGPPERILKEFIRIEEALNSAATKGA